MLLNNRLRPRPQAPEDERAWRLIASAASRFASVPGNDRQYDLVVTRDGATDAVYSGFLVEEEGTASRFRALAEMIDRHGLFSELSTDRGSHCFHTSKAGGVQDHADAGRARLGELGVRHIAAYSPEACGRFERAFRTPQDRLPKELALAGISTTAAANRWLAESYWPAHNAAFAVAPAEAGSAFVRDPAGRVRTS